jgi:ribokinase
VTVFVLGNATLDVIQHVERLPKPGETLLARSLQRCGGGKGLNQALMAARSGASVRLAAPLGDDADGLWLRRQLETESGLTCTWIAVPAPTDMSAIWVDDGGRNVIVSSAAAAMSLTPAHAIQALADMTAADLLLVQGNLSLATTEVALRLARDRGARTLLNTAPIAWDMRPLLRFCSLVIANEVEAEELAARPAAEASDWLRAAGAAAVIVTLGGQGALVDDGTAQEILSAPQVAVVDTSGAGDVLVGVLAAELAAGRPLLGAAGLAIAAASLSVTRAGTTSSFPSAADMARLRAEPGPQGGG